MASPIVGLHHVTAIASDPQRNLDFYTQVLGLRLVKCGLEQAPIDLRQQLALPDALAFGEEHLL